MSKNTIVRGMLVPSLKNKPLDGRQLVPTLGDIVNIENPFVGFIFYVESEGRWYEVVSLTDRIIDELTIPNDMVDEYKEFGKGMTDAEKEEYLTKSLAEQLYLRKEDAVLEYLNKTEAEANFLKKVQAELEYLKKADAEGLYQPKGDYLLKSDADATLATKQELEDLENRIGAGGDGEGGNFIDAPNDGKTYGRKDGLWKELEDAPSDGFTYGRVNGKWAVIEGEGGVVTSLPIITINIGSSLGVDPVIDKVKAEVSYADKVFYVGNGGKVNVPYGLTATITFPIVSDYEAPETIVIENVMGDTTRSVEYKYVRSIVNVYVSADDASSVDGQKVTVDISSESDVLRNGVFIEDTDGNIYDLESWVEDKIPNSVVLIDDKLKVRMAMYEYYSYWYGNTGTSLEKRIATAEEALTYMDGEGDSSMYNTKLYSDAKNYAFPNGLTGAYVASTGELAVIQKYWDNIVKCFIKFGISMKSLIHSSTTSTQTNNSGIYTWNMDMLTGVPQTSSGDPDPYFLFLRKITSEDTLRVLTSKEYEVVGGQVSFSCLKNDNVTVSIDSKGENYSRPESVLFVSDGSDKNISMVYNLLVIDTIYINNLIADTSSIISGEMNGKAVQAIWNNVHRYLGKIVTKEDGTEELVLLDIDQNDNRYYTDGSMIDLEALGTTAYFFTKIPAMSYKITQMSDNIYKVQISYKHKPEGDGWKHFDELIVPTFNYSGTGGLNERPTYYGDTRHSTKDLTYPNELTTVDVLDYSNIALLLYAKYGVGNIENVEEFDLGTFVSSDTVNYYKNGFSLRNGKKDAKYKSENGSNYIYNFLGIENFVLRCRTIADSSYTDAFLINGSDNSAQMTLNDSYILKVDTKKYLGSFQTVGLTAMGGDLYIKKLIIDDVFLAFGLEVGGTSETYYKESIYWNLTLQSINYPKFEGLCGGMISSSYNSSNAYLDKLKYVGKYRIESDREAFEALTNIWV